MATAKTARIIVAVQLTVVVAATVKAAISLFRIVTTSSPDFFYYYEAAGEVIHRVPRPIHLLPPASLLAFSPLALVPYDFMQAVWVFGSFICLVAIILAMARREAITDRLTVLTLVALTYLSFPSQFTLGMGQVNLYALALIVASIFLEKKQPRAITAGLFALAILVKPETILLLAVVMAYRRWASFFAISAWLATAVVLSVGIYGIDAYVRYGERMQNAAGAWRDYGIYYNQGLSGLLARMGTGDVWWYGILSLLIIGLSALAFRKKQVMYPDALWLAVPLLLLVEPIAWQHHFVLLIPTFFTLWRRETRRLSRGLLVAGYVLISWNFASPGFLSAMPLGWLPASHGTVGAFILWLVSIL